MNELMQTIEGQNGCLSFPSQISRTLHVTLLLPCVCLLFPLHTFNVGCQLPVLQELLQHDLQTNTHACQMLGLHDSSSTLLKLHTVRTQSLRNNVALTQGTIVCALLPLIPHASLPLFECCIAFQRQIFRDSECTEGPKLVVPQKLLFKHLHTAGIG